MLILKSVLTFLILIAVFTTPLVGQDDSMPDENTMHTIEAILNFPSYNPEISVWQINSNGEIEKTGVIQKAGSGIVQTRDFITLYTAENSITYLGYFDENILSIVFVTSSSLTEEISKDEIGELREWSEQLEVQLIKAEVEKPQSPTAVLFNSDNFETIYNWQQGDEVELLGEALVISRDGFTREVFVSETGELGISYELGMIAHDIENGRMKHLEVSGVFLGYEFDMQVIDGENVNILNVITIVPEKSGGKSLLHVNGFRFESLVQLNFGGSKRNDVGSFWCGFKRTLYQLTCPVLP